MFKKILFLFLSFSLIFFCYSIVTANGSSEWERTPSQIINNMKDGKIQNTALKNVWWSSQWINWTLNGIKTNSNSYIQWLWFIWLSVAFILIIYNGMLLLWNFTWEDKLSKAKKRFLSLILWVIVLTTWYVIIKLVVSLVWGIF